MPPGRATDRRVMHIAPIVILFAVFALTASLYVMRRRVRLGRRKPTF